MPPKKTTAQFIEEATARFGDKYDYSLVEYKGSHHKVKLICNEHGVFEQAAREFLDKGRGCPSCSSRKPMTTERFISESSDKYGGVYDYSKSVCTATAQKVCVICKVDGHGEFWPVANNHIRGKAGCPKCAGNVPLGSDVFLARANELHDGKYTYGDIAYTNNTTPVEIFCKEHGAFLQSPMAHLAGQGCPKCANKGHITTESFIALARSIHGDKFDYSLSVFKTAKSNMIIRCNEHGHIFHQTYGSHIHQKAGCNKCAKSFLRTTQEFIDDAIAVHGSTYDYSKVVYTGTSERVVIICKVHGEFEQIAGSHLSGQGCAKCYSENRKYTTEEYIELARAAHNDKYTYENVTYSGMTTPVVVTCPEHGDWSVIAGAHLHRKTGCAKCASVSLLTTDEFVAKARKVHGDKYEYSKVEYVNYNTKITVTCKKHGDWLQTPDSHLQGKGCSICANVGPSKAQLAISEFLTNYTPVILEHKFPGSTRRFDIYLPEKHLAIEYNGLYWHSSRTEAIERESEKHALAKANGVRVITVFQDEWHYQPDVVQNTLLSAMGELPKIFARKCTVMPLTTEDVGHFYLENHVQGSPQSSVHFGLFNSGDLVACMSFGMLRSSRRNTDRRHWELTRYASTCTVVGGASKLLKAFRRENLADKLTSYSDARMFSGNMYAQLGFTRTHQTLPDYYYVNLRVATWRVHKAKFQKKHLAKLFPGCDIENKTEKEICEENGYYQVYDCGKVRWDLDLST
jgi:hypothetical protein